MLPRSHTIFTTLVFTCLALNTTSFRTLKSTKQHRPVKHRSLKQYVSQSVTPQAFLIQPRPKLLPTSPTILYNGGLSWNDIADCGYLITCPNGDPGSERLNRAKAIMGKLGLMDIVEVKEFQTDDEDRIRGCYNSHIEIYKEIAAKYAGSEDYSVLVLEDNVSESPQLSQSTVSNLASFQSQRSGDWDMLHLAYIMYVPGLQVTRTEMDGVVSLSTGEQAALGTTAYVISKRGVDALLEYHEKVSRR